MIRVASIRSIRAAAVALSCAAAGHAWAGPLPKEACEAAVAEHAKLVQAGVPELVKKGPATVAAGQDAGRVGEVARYIELEEQLLFRCGHDRLRAAAAGAQDDEAGESPAAAPPPLPQRKPKASAPGGRPSPHARATEAETAPKPAPKPKRPPKVDDAFRPPPKAAPQE